MEKNTSYSYPFAFVLHTPEFRAKNNEGKWVYGFFVGANKEVPLHLIVDSKTSHPVDQKTVSQCTRVLDVEGSKIYEGDIVLGTAKHKTAVGLGVVVWYPGGGWCLCLIKTGAKFPLDTYTNLKKEGNIWDNKYLIPQGVSFVQLK